MNQSSAQFDILFAALFVYKRQPPSKTTHSKSSAASGVYKIQLNHPKVGTLPDFGNFRIQGDEWYDRYQGMKELMPYAKAVSAKSHEFDEKGNETGSDFYRIMNIVLDAGYKGYVGIEYEGSVHTEMKGIRLTNELLKKIRDSI